MKTYPPGARVLVDLAFATQSADNIAAVIGSVGPGTANMRVRKIREGVKVGMVFIAGDDDDMATLAEACRKITVKWEERKTAARLYPEVPKEQCSARFDGHCGLKDGMVCDTKSCPVVPKDDEAGAN